ncbi:hypothetical protein GRP75_20880 [Paenibacillus sp. OT2-17]|uniref:hypothetical protein n=1 Tax=unclassified Paenibacillus TaxID=185978 RepID=UPI001352D55B|nr:MULTISPECIES: hypothetical protein [unclassified Paenibacillus]MXO80210.1 hypothetical protein [Paenibacillus sp. OT2-17]
MAGKMLAEAGKVGAGLNGVSFSSYTLFWFIGPKIINDNLVVGKTSKSITLEYYLLM